MKKETTLSFLFLFLLFVTTSSFAQISAGGTPPSFIFETENAWLSSTVDLPIDFDVVEMRTEDAKRTLENLPPRVGKIIPVKFTTENSGEWTTLPDGQEIWRLCIYAEDAIAIMLTYDKFEIPAGGKLFIYNNDRSRILGAYTEENNPKRVEYATEFVAGDMITLEYVTPVSGSLDSPVIISGIVYGYNNMYSKKEGGLTRIDFGGSGACMVNVICSEGNNWTDQKKGVARIVTPSGGYVSLCSGTVVNNTVGNLDPLFLSAFHCYKGMTTSEINQSVYYFHYEHPTCSGRSDPDVPTVTGATILVNIPLSAGSDGCLLRLNENIPQSYGVYYNGWDRRNTAATSGVGIHHPNGDIKKISTFTASAQSVGNVNFGTDWGSTASNSMWRVIFVATANGHGVTEGGSSGSPLFNQNKRVVGTLSGGSSSCKPAELNGPNYYGKLWYHWNQYSSSQQMKTYLDPINSGAEYIDGTYTTTSNCNPPSNLAVNYTSDCKANLTWNSPAKMLTHAVSEVEEEIAPETPTYRGNATFSTASSHHEKPETFREEEPKSGWLSWCGTYNNAIGTGAPADFIVAARFTAADLTASSVANGDQITKVRFIPYNTAGITFTIQIYQGGTSATNPGTLKYQQVVTQTLSTEVYNEITLTTPYTINTSQELWIAYRLQITQNEQYPAGCDAGPRVTGKGDLIYYDGWSNLYALTTESDGGPVSANWNIQAYVTGTTPDNVAYNVYRDGTSIATNITTTSYTDQSFTTTAEHTWAVKVACSGGGESNPTTATKTACQQQYTITASTGSNGKISPSGTITVNKGASQTFTFTPNSGYEINQVLVDGSNNSDAVTNKSYTFTNVTANHTISVSFKAIFVPVTNITNLPFDAVAGTPLTLTGTVVPSNATNKTIVWKVTNAGTSGATISGSTFNATAEGDATVRATVANGLAVGSNYTQDFNIKVTTVGISEFTQNFGIMVFPNPTTGEITIDNGELTIDNVEIFDIYGRKQEAGSRRQKAEGEMVINISNLAAGIYFLKVNDQMLKVIKN